MAIKHCVENLADVIEARKNNALIEKQPTATQLKIQAVTVERDALLAEIESLKAILPEVLAAQLSEVRAEKQLIKEKLKLAAAEREESGPFVVPEGTDPVLASILRFQMEAGL